MDKERGVEEVGRGRRMLSSWLPSQPRAAVTSPRCNFEVQSLAASLWLSRSGANATAETCSGSPTPVKSWETRVQLPLPLISCIASEHITSSSSAARVLRDPTSAQLISQPRHLNEDCVRLPEALSILLQLPFQIYSQRLNCC